MAVELLIIVVFFAPILFLIWALVRHASRIRREAIDKDVRTQHLDQLRPELVEHVLERDQHTCQRCGATTDVGVDFTGPTPGEGQEITPDDLEACCVRCFQRQWDTLREPVSSETEREGIIPRIW